MGIGSNSELLRINNPILVLGRYISANGKRGRIVKASYELLNYGVVIVGPPGSGKTESLMIPMTLDLLYHGHSVVTIDVKGDLYDRLTPNIDQQKIRVILWDCLDPRSLSWNWLTSINSTLDIEGTVQSILGRDNPADPNPFFYHRDYRWLVSLLNIFTHLDIPDKTPDLLYRTLVNQDSIRQLFKDFSVLRPYENELSDLLNFNPGEYSLAVSGLLNALFLFNTPQVRRISTRNTIDLNSICNTPTLLIIGSPLSDAKRGEILSSIMINRMINIIYGRFNKHMGNNGLVFMLDEAARLVNRISLAEVSSVIRGAQAGICLLLQNVTQIPDHNERDTILGNCQTMITLRNCSSQSAEYMSQRLGQKHSTTIVTSSSKKPFGLFTENVTRSEQNETTPVLSLREIMSPPQVCGKYCGILHSTILSYKPIIIDLSDNIRR